MREIRALRIEATLTFQMYQLRNNRVRALTATPFTELKSDQMRDPADLNGSEQSNKTKTRPTECCLQTTLGGKHKQRESIFNSVGPVQWFPLFNH